MNKNESANLGAPVADATHAPSLPAVVERATFEAEHKRLRFREKRHTREHDAIVAARWRLPMAEVQADLTLTGRPGRPPCPRRSRRAAAAHRLLLHVEARPTDAPAV
ncbi:DUF899 family protein [Spirillospora sp. CA-255316]